MPRSKRLPPLTPRAKQLVTLVVNAVALGNHDDDAEVGALAEQMETTPARLAVIVRKLQEQGYVEDKGGFIYPTVAALQVQQPSLSDLEAKSVLRKLR